MAPINNGLSNRRPDDHRSVLLAVRPIGASQGKQLRELLYNKVHDFHY
jgi:hypothetical protein